MQRCARSAHFFQPRRTQIGTPLSPHATKVMLLGSGELGKEVLIALQRLGVETIAVDRYETRPASRSRTMRAPSR
jgi:phosphoribosylglycinamide formyltransferase 2